MLAPGWVGPQVGLTDYFREECYLILHLFISFLCKDLPTIRVLFCQKVFSSMVCAIWNGSIAVRTGIQAVADDATLQTEILHATAAKKHFSSSLPGRLEYLST